MRIQDPLIYPLKSARGIAATQCMVQPRGLAGDRRWMVIDSKGRFVTARKFPAMVLIEASVDPIDAALLLRAASQPVLRIPVPPESVATIDVQIWQSTSPARIADAAANAWISTYLDGEYRLVHMADDCLRGVSQTWARRGDIVSFADGFPLLLIGTASLAELNRRLARPVTMANFRPNLIVETEVPFVEDGWTRVRIGAVEFEVSKPCTRCVLTTVDPVTGVRSEDGEPLATLKTFRAQELGIMFGQNLIPRGIGVLCTGDPVVVL